MIRVYLGLGSNTEREKHLQSAIDALTAEFGSLQLSPVYESESVGFAGSLFLNMVIGFDTSMPLADLQARLKQIEDDNGRLRGGPKFSPRTLDIDVLTYGDFISDDAELDIPRAEILENAFVLLPLSDLAPMERHPVLGKSYSQLWQAYTKPQKLWRAEFQCGDCLQAL